MPTHMRLHAETLHLTESLTRLGGVETIIQQLLQHDEGSYAAGLLDSPDTAMAKGVGLRAGKHAGACLLRRAARASFAHARHLVFHNFAGMMMLSGAIPHDRKCLFLHTNSPDIFDLLPQRLPYLDTIVVGGIDLANEIRQAFPQIDIPVVPLDCPIDDCYFGPAHRHANPCLVIGYAGRLETEQKQVLRLVDLCETLDALSLPFRLEIAGCGSAMEELRRRLPAEKCRFLGVLDAAKLHEIYQQWDFLICTSDYETGPLVAMEAMAAGVLPIMPDIPCQTTRLIAGLGLPCYSIGDMQKAGHLIQQLAGTEALAHLRMQMREQVADRRIGRFVNQINATLAESTQRPAVARTPAVPHGLNEYLPFSLRRAGSGFLR